MNCIVRCTPQRWPANAFDWCVNAETCIYTYSFGVICSLTDRTIVGHVECGHTACVNVPNSDALTIEWLCRCRPISCMGNSRFSNYNKKTNNLFVYLSQRHEIVFNFCCFSLLRCIRNVVRREFNSLKRQKNVGNKFGVSNAMAMSFICSELIKLTINAQHTAHIHTLLTNGQLIATYMNEQKLHFSYPTKDVRREQLSDMQTWKCVKGNPKNLFCVS